MPSTLIRSTDSAAHVFIDDMPPLADAMRDVIAYRASELPVPSHLLNSVRAYRLSTLADAIERYNDRVTTRVAATA
jgi:hypothetical protein